MRDAVQLGLLSAGYEVVTEVDGRRAEDRFQGESFDLVILDIELPGQDGLQLCRKIRERSTVPVIMLTGRTRTVDVVIGLESGASDYIRKPFELPELIARVRAVLRTALAFRGAQPIQVANLHIDPRSYKVYKAGKEIYLSPIEFRLLFHLALHRDQVLGRSRLLRDVWQHDCEDSRVVDMAIRRLRSKVEEDPHHPRLIRTIRGAGYVLSAQASLPAR